MSPMSLRVFFTICLPLVAGCHRHSQPPCVPKLVAVGEGAPSPERLMAVVHAAYPHAPDAYTEGLLWHDGWLYEGTGLDDRSDVRKVALDSGRVVMRWPLPCNVFGEGIAVRGGEIFELTWDSNVVFVWDAQSIALRRRIPLNAYGWGLSYLPKEDLFLASDGSEMLTWRRPDDFAPVRNIAVVRENKTICNLNELEPVGDAVWVNVYGATEHEILRVDPRTGYVTGVVDVGDLTRENHAGVDRELNGIAWIPERRTFAITGKHWTRLYEVTFEDARNVH